LADEETPLAFDASPAVAADAGVVTELEHRLRGADAVYYATQMRGVSNAKAKRELNFQPRPLEWTSA